MLYSSIAILIIAADMLTKQWAVNYLQPIRDIPLWNGILHLTYVENTGAAFGMMRDMRWVFIVISIAAVIGIIWYLFKVKPANLWLKLGLAFVLGGAVGNLIDRIRLGYVVDFIHAKVINFPVFNLADIFVCTGGFLIAIYCIIIDREKK